nr:fasciclin-3-like [Aedes albopictus]
MTYFGAGYQAGACGVTIDRITTAHNGQFKCSLFDTDRSNEGFINVVVAVAPEQPQIQLEQPTSASAFEVNSEMVVHCISRYGSPAASLYWFLDDEPIYDGISQPEYHEENNQGYSVYVTLRRHILASDSGKRLICRAKHVAYRDEMAETSLQIIVNYAPQALPETTVHGLTLGRTVDVTVQIHANPAPRVMWVVDGMTIEQGQEHDRYAARVPERLDNGAFNVTLTIAGLTLEDLSKRYQLQASNQVGVQDYVVLLSSLDAEVDESGGVGVGGIIGIVLAALIVLVAIALIIMARATGRWCFRGKASSTTTSNARIGESSDTESAEVKQPITKTQRLKILFGRKRAELGDSMMTTTATGGEEIVDNELIVSPAVASGGGAADDVASEDYATVDPGAPKRQPPTASKTDEPATLVYAELQLKPPAEHGYVSKPAESTEYAEILYVQNSEGKTGPVVVGEESGERPTASAVQPPATKPEPSAGDQKK